MPLKTTREIALGRVARPYHHLSDESDPNCRHVVGVDWQRTVPRSALKQDLLYTLGSVLSIFSPTRNDGHRRLEQVLETGTDPGNNMKSLVNHSEVGVVEDEVVDAPEIAPDIEQVALDQITSRIGEEFAGHGLAHLVAELMRAEGFTVDEAPPGPDGGIDILAGKGVLGLESPKIVVQVKTGTVERPMIQQLTGLVGSQGADFGLIVTWAGLTGPAKDEVRSQRFRIKVWDNTDVVDAVLRNYARLPEEVRASLPMKQVWVLSDAG
ncbi:restriction endonuclease [Kocuria rosea]|uniref:restriction endonuclease n=1 Tax=Kocuria rosea TaxID=1275 RepID=UPI002B24C26D|nr:restriction endonuclease [Kocuria rosea]MEB2529151.1 restriction endonuclease [Kocuria rosea]MEB2619652.1 restriction endonuclease [Kocuria rosea]